MHSECVFFPPHLVPVLHKHLSAGRPYSSCGTHSVGTVPQAESIPDRNHPLPKASVAQLLKLIKTLEGREERKEGLQAVDKDGAAGKANSDKFES